MSIKGAQGDFKTEKSGGAMTIYKVGIDRNWGSYTEMKKESVAAQGFSDTGDLSFIFKSSLETKKQDYDEVKKLEKEQRFSNFIKRMFDEIKEGDFCLAFEGNSLMGICEIPPNFIYFFNEKMREYKHCLFPVKWIDWDNFCSNSALKEQMGQGVVGIEVCGLPKINGYINENWENYKKSHLIQIQSPELNGKLQKLKDNFPQKQKESREIFYAERKKGKNMKRIDELVKQLKEKKNIILTGAPGVGKTYKTAEIALSILGKDIGGNRKDLMEEYKKAVADGLIAFTTFHQSLDYEEFIEGLKPFIDDESKTVLYEVKNGIFKEICRKAKEQNSFSELDEAIDKFKEECSEEQQKLKTKQGKEFSVSYNHGNTTFGIPKENRSYPTTVNINHIRKLFENNFDDKKVEGMYNVSYVRGILMHLMDKYEVKEYQGQLQNQNYVLIIDEINRGNISKIFGELITLLEKDKRLGGENEITATLPYSQEVFGVPSNLYIIGTMNTADRSIGHIDYAVRRRFVFASLKSDREVIENYSGYDDENTREKALKLFKTIGEFIDENINEDLDNDDLMIGHSYFLCKTKEELGLRLEHEIIPLIKEYEKDGIFKADKSEMEKRFQEWRTL